MGVEDLRQAARPLSLAALDSRSPLCRWRDISPPRGRVFPEGDALGKEAKSFDHRSTPCTRQPITNKLPSLAKAPPPGGRWHRRRR